MQFSQRHGGVAGKMEEIGLERSWERYSLEVLLDGLVKRVRISLDNDLMSFRWWEVEERGRTWHSSRRTNN